ncbi:MAG TPA: hypothetical protein VFP48_00455, partial [Steroidobacteraceae bacterium]|nr:hypothetical protein [Steroidobacteraceae bacterium]
MRTMRLTRSLALIALLAASPLAVTTAQTAEKPAATAPVPGPGPQELIQKVSQDLLRDLDANRAVYTRDQKQLRGLVDKYLLPNFDV